MSADTSTLDARFVPAIVAEEPAEATLPVAAIEQFRTLARRLDAAREAGGPRAFLVTSPASGDGRTSTALYTAVALAGRGHRVVLVDFDLRKPDLAAWHDVPQTPGLVDVVRGEATLDQALRLVPGSRGMVLLPAGEAQSDPAPIFFDPGLKRLLESLRASFDFVVCDSPPALGLADVSCIGDLLGSALLVSRAGVTSRTELLATVNALTGMHIIGSVLLGVESFMSIETTHAAQALARKPATTALARR